METGEEIFEDEAYDSSNFLAIRLARRFSDYGNLGHLGSRMIFFLLLNTCSFFVQSNMIDPIQYRSIYSIQKIDLLEPANSI